MLCQRTQEKTLFLWLYVNTERWHCGKLNCDCSMINSKNNLVFLLHLSERVSSFLWEHNNLNRSVSLRAHDFVYIRVVSFLLMFPSSNVGKYVDFIKTKCTGEYNYIVKEGYLNKLFVKLGHRNKNYLSKYHAKSRFSVKSCKILAIAILVTYHKVLNNLTTLWWIHHIMVNCKQDEAEIWLKVVCMCSPTVFM